MLHPKSEKALRAHYVSTTRRLDQAAHVRLENGLARAPAGEWADLEVKGSDFRRYLDGLHSIW